MIRSVVYKERLAVGSAVEEERGRRRENVEATSLVHGEFIDLSYDSNGRQGDVMASTLTRCP